MPTIDGTQLQERIAALRGKVVLVDFWATWCPSCVEALPHTLELGRTLADRDLQVITVSLDSAERLDSVREVLRAHGALEDCYIAAHGASVQTFEEFDIDAGAIPCFVLYDRAGRRHGAYQSSEDVESAVRKLLSQVRHDEAQRPSE